MNEWKTVEELAQEDAEQTVVLNVAPLGDVQHAVLVVMREHEKAVHRLSHEVNILRLAVEAMAHKVLAGNARQKESEAIEVLRSLLRPAPPA